jgi:hypothetical protein
MWAMRAQLCAGLFLVLLLLLLLAVLLLPSFGHGKCVNINTHSLMFGVHIFVFSPSLIGWIIRLRMLVFRCDVVCVVLSCLRLHRHGSHDNRRLCSRNCSRSGLGTQLNQVYPTVKGHHRHPELSGQILKRATLHWKIVLLCAPNQLLRKLQALRHRDSE